MSAGKVQVYYGDGRGKTSAALGYAIHEASKGESVVIIQFLKQKDDDEISFISRLEPEIRLFRFQKSEKFYDELSEQEQLDEQMNMKNGMNYARKVLQTGECKVLILDEVLGLLDHQIIADEELINLIGVKSEETDLILTGRHIREEIMTHSDFVYEIRTKKG
jgi:cob(I)alamin adenosyltransferase